MKFGFFKIFFVFLFLIIGGAFAWLAFMDLPVQQQEITVNVPLTGAQ